MDEIGEKIKRLVFMQVLGGKSINNDVAFYNAVKDTEIKIQVILIKGEI